MQTIKEKVNHLNQLILEGKALEGFDLYYDDEVVMQENEILNKVSTGININELADSFAISPLTVKCHLRNIYSKLHVTNKVEAINKLNKNNNFF